MGSSRRPLLDDNFVTGGVRYEDSYPGHEQHARMVIRVTLAGYMPVLAVLDTASPWCVLNPQIVDIIAPAIEPGYRPKQPIVIRGIEYYGEIVRLLMRLDAEI